MGIPLYQVDAFAAEPFGGNPAAVCLLSAPRDDAWMLRVAREMNLSETAFVLAREDGFSLRWFTPAVEVDLCGHATLASAHVLWETGRLAPDAPARFHTRSGLLTARRAGDWIEMDFPALPESPAEPPAGLADALGVRPCYVGRIGFAYLVEVDLEATVRALHPDFRALAAVCRPCVIVTARADTAGCDFVSRFFAPRIGIDEDPVTGSAHCCLGPFWAGRLGKSNLVGYQCSERGGVVRVRAANERVVVAGRAITVFRGEWVA